MLFTLEKIYKDLKNKCQKSEQINKIANNSDRIK